METGDDGGGLAHDGKHSCKNYILKLLAFKFVLYHALPTSSSSLQNNVKNTTGLAAIQQAARVYATVTCAVCNWVNETSETTKTGSTCGYVGVGISRNRTHNYKISTWRLFGRCSRVTSLFPSHKLSTPTFSEALFWKHIQQPQESFCALPAASSQLWHHWLLQPMPSLSTAGQQQWEQCRTASHRYSSLSLHSSPCSSSTKAAVQPLFLHPHGLLDTISG